MDTAAANVLIHEEGRLQLCDFGVATVLETKGDKRQTFIGTLHWMAPEQWDQKPEYSDEVCPARTVEHCYKRLTRVLLQIDVWAFGCTIYECALGKPPNADLREPQQLRTRMRRLNKAIELPESGGFPENLRSLVSFTLSPNAANRPSMTQVLDHDYLRDTEHTHPTSGLSELVNDYYSWLWSGGQRTSLFMKGGAVVSDAPGSLTTPDDEWNFSTTVDYEKRISKILDVPEIIEPSSVQSPEGEVTPKALKENVSSLLMNERTATQQANFEARVQRGADLSNIFDQNKPTYEYKTKHDFVPIPEPQMARRASDLPLRAMAEDRPSSIASNVIDLGDFDSSNYATVAPTKEETIRLADAATIRAKRGDSKLYKEDSNTDIPKITRTPSAEGDYPDVAQHDGPDDQSFSFPPNSWKKDESNVATTSTEDTSTVKKPKARQTMEWSFDEAMSDVEKDEPAVETTDDNKTKKHATMQWSFADAMKDMSASPPTATTTTSSTITPSRPGLLRQATMPVTHSEFSTAEEEIEEPPRPSTAQSETSSIASSDADPFALDPDMPPMPDAIAKALDERNISHYYYTEGRTLFADQDPIPYDPAVFTGQQPPQPYPTGAPARVGEPGFPGQNLSAVPPFTRAGAGASAAAANTTMARDREEAEGGPFALSLPPIRPPDPAALAHDADPEVVARELSRGLGDLEALLRGIGEVGVFGGGGRGRKGMEAGGGAGGAGAGAGGGGGGHERGRSSDFETTDEE